MSHASTVLPAALVCPLRSSAYCVRAQASSACCQTAPASAPMPSKVSVSVGVSTTKAAKRSWISSQRVRWPPLSLTVSKLPAQSQTVASPPLICSVAHLDVSPLPISSGPDQAMPLSAAPEAASITSRCAQLANGVCSTGVAACGPTPLKLISPQSVAALKDA